MPLGQTFPGRCPSHEVNRDRGAAAADEDLTGGESERESLSLPSIYSVPLRVVGSPALFHAVMPPASTLTAWKPFPRRSAAALTERPSMFQTVTIACVRCAASSSRCLSSMGNGHSTASVMCPRSPTNSSGFRTSSTSGASPCESNAWSRGGDIFPGRRQRRMSEGSSAAAASRASARQEKTSNWTR